MAQKKPPEQTRKPNRGSLTLLPAEGCDLPVPKWPLKVGPTTDEKAIWDSVWTFPQAEHWHALRSHRVVARYVRLLVRAEDVGGSGAGVNYQSEVRQLEDRLGLTPRAAHMLNYRMVEPTLAPVTNLDSRLAKAEAEARKAASS